MRTECVELNLELNLEYNPFSSFCEQGAVTAGHWDCFEFFWIAAP